MPHVLSLARLACASARGWAAEQANTLLRFKAELGRCHEANAQLCEERRISHMELTMSVEVSL